MRDAGFQCSSASRKFLNRRSSLEPLFPHARFSALQRAENSSIWRCCTSKSMSCCCFSALQRAENSSIGRMSDEAERFVRVSVLFSEPKIPQLAGVRGGASRNAGFSALQRAENSSIAPRARGRHCGRRFQCSSASRKFLNAESRAGAGDASRFQCSSASRKFLNLSVRRSNNGWLALFQCSSASRKFLNLVRVGAYDAPVRVSVLFSEPKIPQFDP